MDHTPEKKERAQKSLTLTDAKAPSTAPIRFGRFELLKRVSRGGMGELYLARVTGPYEFEKRVVLKMIKREQLSDQIYLRFFSREARIGAILTHPNIVQVFEFGKVGSRYFISMEFVEGVSVSRLRRYLRDRDLVMPSDVSSYIISETAEALHYLHFGRKLDGSSLQVIHRDVSPENILLSIHGDVKLADFGLVKYHGAEHLTRMGKVRGKVHYMAPERLLGHKADIRSDQYSLGLVFHELLTGYRYFGRDMDHHQLVEMIVHEVIQPPGDEIAGVSKKIDSIIAKSTALASGERYDTLKSMRRDVLSFLRARGREQRAKEQLALLVKALQGQINEEVVYQICRRRRRRLTRRLRDFWQRHFRKKA